MKTPFFISVLLLIFSLTPGWSRLVEVSGSDYIPEALITALNDFAKSRGDEMVASMNGSLLAFRDLELGEADIILVTIPDKGPEDFAFPVLPLGFQIAVVAVNAANPIESINARQLGGIFGGGTGTSIARWGQLGLSSAEWRTRNIQAGYTRPNVSPVIDMFNARFLNNEPFRPSVQEFQSPVHLESYIANNDASIGIMAGLPLSDKLKAVRLEQGTDGIAFGPTEENINFGDYPLSLNYYVAVPLSQYRFLAPYLDFLLSDEVAEILNSEGFFPVIESSRIRLRSELPTAPSQ